MMILLLLDTAPSCFFQIFISDWRARKPRHRLHERVCTIYKLLVVTKYIRQIFASLSTNKKKITNSRIQHICTQKITKHIKICLAYFLFLGQISYLLIYLFFFQYGFNMVIQHREAINCISLSLIHKSLRTKALVLELLAAICLVKGGHEIILSAFDNFKEVCHEAHRFQTLMDYFLNYEVFHIEFMVRILGL